MDVQDTAELANGRSLTEDDLAQVVGGGDGGPGGPTDGTGAR
jgi:bacteriocin-like protein